MKLVVFDFDSTLMDGETIDYLAEAVGKKEQISKITKKAMKGELDFFSALTERVALLKGLSELEALRICQNLPLMPAAKESIAEIKNRGHKVVIFSGGFRMATGHFAKVLKVDADFANFLHIENKVLSGKVGGEMMTSDAKGKLLARLQSLLAISKKDTVAIGDGANDLSMFEHAGTKIAFCAKPILNDAADYIVDKKDLRAVLEHIL